MRKVAILGAGRVGETTAQILAEDELGREVVLIGVREDAPQGVALDIFQALPCCEFDTRLSDSNASPRNDVEMAQFLPRSDAVRADISRLT